MQLLVKQRKGASHTLAVDFEPVYEDKKLDILY
jgi:hypothetical protein